MSAYFSPSTGGIYPADMRADYLRAGSWPADAVLLQSRELDDVRAWLAAGGRVVVGDNGGIELLDPLPRILSVSDYVDAVQRHLDSKAKDFGYDNIHTAVTYAEEPAVAKFQQEGMAFRAWRSLCWAHCYSVLDDVTAGKRPQPSVADILGELPPLALGGANV